MVAPSTTPDRTTCPLHSGMVERLDAQRQRVEKLEEAIVGLQNRLPVWATLLISALTCALGASLATAFGG